MIVLNIEEFCTYLKFTPGELITFIPDEKKSKIINDMNPVSLRNEVLIS